MADIEEERAWMKRMSDAVHGTDRTTWADEMREVYRRLDEAKARTRERSERATCHYCGQPWQESDRAWVMTHVGPSTQDMEPYSHIECYDQAHPDAIWYAAPAVY